VQFWQLALAVGSLTVIEEQEPFATDALWRQREPGAWQQESLLRCLEVESEKQSSMHETMNLQTLQLPYPLADEYYNNNI